MFMPVLVKDRYQERRRRIAAYSAGPHVRAHFSGKHRIAPGTPRPVRISELMAGLLARGSQLRLAFPVFWASGIIRRRSPLTVAGAATVSVPFGYASPCSLFISGVVLLKKPSATIIRAKSVQSNLFH
jgi:hypothetical protein